jgi:hypothetical protein
MASSKFTGTALTASSASTGKAKLTKQANIQGANKGRMGMEWFIIFPRFL